MLDLLANRCLAQGTNAWTATDHTAYTMETAGSEGFLNLLPVYLDHVLYPTLTVSGLQCNNTNTHTKFTQDWFQIDPVQKLLHRTILETESRTDPKGSKAGPVFHFFF